MKVKSNGEGRQIRKKSRGGNKSYSDSLWGLDLQLDLKKKGKREEVLKKKRSPPGFRNKEDLRGAVSTGVSFLGRLSSEKGRGEHRPPGKGAHGQGSFHVTSPERGAHKGKTGGRRNRSGWLTRPCKKDLP